MRILLLNPPHPSIGSRIPDKSLPPLGLLAIGGPLIDAGHDVTLLDADIEPMKLDEIVRSVILNHPEALLIGHTGSTSAHPIIMSLTRSIRTAMPALVVVYGGVFPTYHHRDILENELQIDVIVRGEGEETATRLMAAIQSGSNLEEVDGIVFRCEGRIIETRPARMIEDLDTHRIGWELVNFSRYQDYGGRRSVVVQFSRGCPHHCSYCGQRGFWARWRHRDPKRFAAELAWLYRQHGVTHFNLADENPTVNRSMWKQLCEEIIAQEIDISIVGTTRADDIVRDADILALYRKAGVVKWVLGMESTDEATLQKVRKGGAVKTDREAIRVLRENGILSLAIWVADFEDVTDRDMQWAMRQLISYDPDQVMAVFATPHRWTGFYTESMGRRVVQTDQSRWDYKHQVLESSRMPPWRVMFWVMLIQFVVQTRPVSLWRTFLQPDREARHGMRWYAKMGRRVWLRETFQFVTDKRARCGPTLRQFWGAPQQRQEIPLLTNGPVLQEKLTRSIGSR